MRDGGVDCLCPANQASFGGEDDERNGVQRTFDVVLALGEEGRLQRLDAMGVVMIHGAGVVSRFINDVPVDNEPASVRFVHVLSR